MGFCLEIVLFRVIVRFGLEIVIRGFVEVREGA